MIFLHRRRFETPHRRCTASQRVAGPLPEMICDGLRSWNMTYFIATCGRAYTEALSLESFISPYPLEKLKRDASIKSTRMRIMCMQVGQTSHKGDVRIHWLQPPNSAASCSQII